MTNAAKAVPEAVQNPRAQSHLSSKNTNIVLEKSDLKVIYPIPYSPVSTKSIKNEN